MIELGEDTKKERKGISSRMKSELLVIFQEIMDNRDTRFGQGSILMSVMFIQLWGYIFDSEAQFPFHKDDFYANACYIFDIFRIYPLLTTTAAYLATAFGTIILIILYFLSLFYISYSLRKHKMYFKFPLKYVRVMNELFYWVLLNPIISIFISIYRCPETYHETATDIECWNSLHIIYILFFSLGLIAFAIIIMIISSLYNESTSYSTDVFTRLDCNMEIYLSIFRMIISLLCLFCKDSYMHWLLISFHFLGTLIFFRMYLTYLPYYYPRISVLFGSGILIHLWFSFHLSLAHFVGSSIGYSLQTVVLLPPIIFSYPILSKQRSHFLNNILLIYTPNKLKKVYKCDLYLNKLLELMSKYTYDDEDATFLLGILINHKTECTTPSCPFNHTHELYLPLTDTTSKREISDMRDPVVIIHLVDSIFLELGKNMMTSASMHMIYSQFLFKKMGNIHMAVIELNLASKDDATLQEKFSIQRSKHNIEEYLVNKYCKQDSSKDTLENLDVAIVITFESLFNKLHRSIEQSAAEYIEFWSILDSLLPDLNLLHKSGLNIIYYSKQTQDIWNKLMKINPRYPKALHIYGYYLSEIINDPEEGEKKIEDSRGLALKKTLGTHANDYEMMFADDTAIIVISGDSETAGKIIKTNSGITPLFGYKAFEVYGHDVALLMPEIIAKIHPKLLNNYFSTGKERALNKEFTLFGRKRSGFILNILLVIKPVPSLTEGIQYIGLIRPQGNDQEYILMDQEGKIDSLTEGITGVLGFSNSGFFKDNTVFIQMLIPELLDVVIGKDKKLLTKLDFANNLDLTFRIPANFPAILQIVTKNLILLSQNIEVEDEEENKSENATLNVHNSQEKKPVKPMKLPSIILKIDKLLKGIGENNISLEEIYEFHKNIVSGNILKEKIDYSDREIEIEKKARCEITRKNIGNGLANLIILSFKKNKEYGESVDTEFSLNMNYVYRQTKPNPSEAKKLQKLGLMHETYKSMKSITSEEIMKKNDESEKDVDHLLEVGADPTNEQMNNVINKSEDIEEIKEESHQPSISIHLDKTIELDITNEEIIPLSQQSSHSPHVRKAQSRFEISPCGRLSSNRENLDMNLDDGRREIIKGRVDNLEYVGKLDQNEEPNLVDDIGSVAASKTLSFSKFIRALRNSMYEKYDPNSVKHLKISARVVFLSLVIVASTSFFLQDTLYNDFEVCTDHLGVAKDRLTSLIRIASNIRVMTIMNPKNPFHLGTQLIDPALRSDYNYSHIGYETSVPKPDDYYTWCQMNVHKFGAQLKEAQNKLATSSIQDLNEDEKINPSKVTIYYQEINELPFKFEIDCWSAIMGIAIHAFKINELESDEILFEEQESINYILTNSFNSILIAIDESIHQIEEINSDRIDKSYNSFLVLCIIASAAILISFAIIFPVVIKVRNNKEEMLSLFVDIPSKSIQAELNKCRKFLSTIRGDSSIREEDQLLDEDDEWEDKENEDGNEDETNILLNTGKSRHSQHKKRNYKAYSKHNLALILKFIIFAAVFETYFLFVFFNSSQFLKEARSLIEELSFINQRQFQNTLLLSSEIELLATNGTAPIKNIPSLDFVNIFIDQMVQNEEDFLRKHGNNKKYNNKDYNDCFDQLVLTNICQEIYKGEKLENCNNYMGGILEKGLHSANLAFWENFRQINSQFLSMPPQLRTISNLKLLLNEDIKKNEILEAHYFTEAYEHLLETMKDGLDEKLKVENTLILSIFLLYLALMAVMYLFIWSLFLEGTRKSLWVTKSMLTIIPPNVIKEIEKIRKFIIESSKSIIFGLSLEV